MSKRCHRTDVHHRLPQALGGTDDPYNLVEVNQAKHRAFHGAFHKVASGMYLPLTAQEIVAELNKYWIDPTFTVVLYQKFPSQLKMTG